MVRMSKHTTNVSTKFISEVYKPGPASIGGMHL
jgi:hypothetical protein